MMLDQMSVGQALDADSTSTATIARMVANAAPAITARNRSPERALTAAQERGQVRCGQVAARAGRRDARLAEERARRSR
jgi:hypothetical protein